MKRKNNKIGLLLACHGSSYGMNLQAFATQYIIEKMGYDTEIINFKSGSGFKGISLDFGLFVYLAKYFLIDKNKKQKIEKTVKSDELHFRNDQLRITAARDFRNRRLHNFTEFMSFADLKDYSSRYYAVLIGSDQCWLPGFSFGRRNTLKFVPYGVRRISYGTSLGVDKYPWYCVNSSRKTWKSFDSISVREEEGKAIINKICGEDVHVEVVLDPTYLILRDEWLSLIPFEKKVEGKYVLSFILGNDVKQQELVRQFADFHKLKLVSILSNESTSPIDCTYADQTIIGATPEEFVNLIRGSEFVFTDSFHGIAFSVINQKQFFVFYRKRDDAKGSLNRNSRINNILRIWKLEHRLIRDFSFNRRLCNIEDINYLKVQDLLIKMRDKSIQYLFSALN